MPISLFSLFTNRHHNRATFPTKHLLICEDDLIYQAELARHFSYVFGGQGEVQISFVSGAVQAAAIMETVGVELILLDHDMPFGSGSDLLSWMKQMGLKTPVITMSGIPENNDRMMQLGARHKFLKKDVMAGGADSLIKVLLGFAG